MTPGRLSPRSEFTPVPSHGSIFVYMIPPQNVMPARVTPAWVHPGCCTGARISLRYEISQRYHVNAKRPPISVWNRSAGIHRRKMSTHALEKMTRDRFRVMSLAPRRKCPRNVAQMREAMAALFGNDSIAISCHCKRSKIILVKVLTEVCSLENIASWNWWKIALAWSDSVLFTLRSLVCVWKTCQKRWLIFALFVYCMFRATRYKNKLWSSERKIIGLCFGI